MSNLPESQYVPARPVESFTQRRKRKFLGPAVVMSVLSFIVFAMFLGLLLGACSNYDTGLLTGGGCPADSGHYEPWLVQSAESAACAGMVDPTIARPLGDPNACVSTNPPKGACFGFVGPECYAYLGANDVTATYERGRAGDAVTGHVEAHFGSCVRSYNLVLTPWVGP